MLLTQLIPKYNVRPDLFVVMHANKIKKLWIKAYDSCHSCNIYSYFISLLIVSLILLTYYRVIIIVSVIFITFIIKFM